MARSKVKVIVSPIDHSGSALSASAAITDTTCGGSVDPNEPRSGGGPSVGAERPEDERSPEEPLKSAYGIGGQSRLISDATPKGSVVFVRM